jgi:hypothetical protein
LIALILDFRSLADMTVQRVDFIKQAHIVFSSYGEANFSGNMSTFGSVSSLVFGAYFIHSYNLSIRDEKSFIFLRTYSRHENKRFAYGFGGDIEVVQATGEYLAVSFVHDSYTVFQ